MDVRELTNGSLTGNRPKRRKVSDLSPRVSRLTVFETAAYLVIFAVAIAILYYGGSVLMPLALAGLLSFVLTPPIRLLKKAGLPKLLSSSVVVSVAIFIIAGGAYVVGEQISDFLTEIPNYQYNLIKKVSSARSVSLESRALERAKGTLEDLQAAFGRSDGRKTTVGPDQTPSDVKPVPVEVHQPPPPVLEATLALISPLVSPLTTCGLIILFLFFILAQREDLRDRFLRLAGTSDLQRTTVALDDAGDRLSRFFIVQGLLNTSFGIFIGVALWAMGLPNAILWGMLAGLMRFVPFIGSVIACVFPIILAAAINPGWSLVLSTATLFFVSELIAGQVIEPMLYGRNTGLSPVAVVVSTLFWTLLWGPVGLILATPLTVCLMVLGKHVEALGFLEVVFGDEPALAPHERLYQRILAGDGIEAIEIAEQSIKEMPLVRYYDDIGLKALSMAYEDAAAGRLARDEIDDVNEAIEDLVDGLSERVATKDGGSGERQEVNGSASAESALVCIPVRSALDEGPLLMLQQVAAEKGINASVVRYNASIRLRAMENLDASAKVVIFGYLGANKLPAFLGILVRRIRSLMPDAKLVLGLWSLGDKPQLAEQWREAAGAGYVATKLEDAVALCEKLAGEGDQGSSAAVVASELPVPRPAAELSG